MRGSASFDTLNTGFADSGALMRLSGREAQATKCKRGGEQIMKLGHSLILYMGDVALDWWIRTCSEAGDDFAACGNPREEFFPSTC
jgi:hypothetical protein